MPVIRELLTKFGIQVDEAKLDKWNKKINKGKQALEKLDAKYRKFAQKTKEKIGTGLGRVTDKMNAFNTRMETSFGNILGPLRSMAQQIPIIGQFLGGITPTAIAAGVAIYGVVKAVQALTTAVQKYLEFEKGMKSVQRVTLATSDNMEKLEEAALKAGEASIFTISQAAEAEKFLAQAGLEVDEVIGALPGTLQLAAAANMDLGRAADIATDIMSAQGLAVKDLTHINDVLVKSATLTTQTVAGMGSGFATVGTEAKQSGLDIAQVAASLGILAKAGLKRELGGTLFRNLLAESKRTKFKKALKDINIDLERFMNTATGEFTDFEGLVKTLSELSKEDMFAFTQDGFAQASRGKRALLALVQMSSELDENLKNIRESSGVAEQASDVAFQGLSGRMALFASKMETAMVSFVKDSGLGNILTDIVATAVNVLPPLVKGLGVLLSPLGFMVSIITKGIRIMSSVVGGALKIVANTGSKLVKIAGIFLNPFTTIIERVLNGIGRLFDAASDVDKGPMTGWLDKFEMLAESFDKWASGILRDLDPLLGVIDILLNVFWFDLPKATEALSKKLDEMANKSIIVRLIRGFLPKAEPEKLDVRKLSRQLPGGGGLTAGGFGGGSLDPIFKMADTLKTAVQDTLAPIPEILDKMPEALKRIDYDKLVEQARQPLPAIPGGSLPGVNPFGGPKPAPIIQIGEIKAEVNLDGAPADTPPLEISTEIAEGTAEQLRDLIREFD